MRDATAPDMLAATAATMATNSALLAELRLIAPALQAAGLRYVVIKAPLQQRILHGTFFQRPAADLDMLVERQDFGRARELLSKAGYALMTPSVWWRDVLGEEHFRKTAPPHVAIDLHHRVHQPGAPAPYGTLRLLDAVEELDIGGIKIPTLTAQGGMLLCTISIAKALYNREPAGAYLCDLYAGLIPASPVAINSFFTSAEAVGLGGHTAVAIRLLSEMFDLRLDLPAKYRDVLSTVAGADLLRMVLLPRDPATHWPKRRLMLWEFCGREPARYSRELARVFGSELTRRLFERGEPA